MHFSNAALICVAAIASVSGYDVPPRPSITPFPKAPGRALPFSPARDPSKVCIVCPKSGGDSAAAILKAAHDCNNGGTVVFMPNATYTISSRVDLTFLKHIDFAILGTIVFNDDNVNLMWRFGGEDVNIYGLGQGTIDGLGQTWWNALAGNSTVNTDGWDTYRSDNIVIQNSVIDNTDDCVSFKPNSTEVLVQDLVCNGSHGISVGSLGQYQGQVDIIENLSIYNIPMSNASDGARIKIWPGVRPNTTGSEAGGGLGHVRNVTYEKYHNVNNDWAIQLTQCYFAASDEACQQYPATLVIEDILFKDFTGTTSKKNDPRVGSLICSDPSVCKNIQAHNINVSPPSGKDPKWTCTNMANSLLDIDCI
ncbi:Exopolygalacturonase A [Colletotrichum viniferum]|nr:Exopolygalacturonase A [Colletotrichum viniferum]